jgi:hypothetical protein
MKKILFIFASCLVLALSLSANASTITIAAETTNPGFWQRAGITGKIRFWAEQGFRTNNGKFVQGGRVGDKNTAYLVVNITVNPDKSISIPPITNLPTTTDSIDAPDVKFLARMYDAKDAEAGDFVPFEFAIPASAGPTTTWLDITIYNNQHHIKPPPGTLDADQIFTLLNNLNNANVSDASVTTSGVVEEATLSEVNAGTAAGSTGARLYVNPSTLAASNYALQPLIPGQRDALVGTSGTPSSTNKYVTDIDPRLAQATTDNRGTVTLAGNGEFFSGKPVNSTDSRLTDARPPTGAASGVLTGTYPGPGFASGAVDAALSASGAVAGSYTCSNITVTSKGIVTAATNGACGGGGGGGVTGNATVGNFPYLSGASVYSDSPFFRFDANTLEQRNGTTAQTLLVDNTWATGGTDVESGKFGWASNILKIGTTKGGTGATRGIDFIVGGTTVASFSTGGVFSLTTPLAVPSGGSGAATFTANNVLLGNGTSAFQVVAPGTNGNLLTSNGTTWVSAAPAGVTSLTGTANQVTVSASTGGVTLSLPQSIHTAATPQFLRLGLNQAADASAPLAITGAANNITLAKIKRNTDTSPTGTFLDLQNAAGSSVASFDINGNYNLSTSSTLAWTSSANFIQIGGNGTLFADTGRGANQGIVIGQNAYLPTGGSWKYISSDEASRYFQNNGAHFFQTAAVGTAGNNITWLDVMRIDAAGSLLVGTTVNTGAKLTVAGLVESTSSGFKFPDGTTQVTAATGAGTVPDATTIVKGVGLVTRAPAVATSPKFVGDNDFRMPTATGGRVVYANEYPGSPDLGVQINNADADLGITPGQIVTQGGGNIATQAVVSGFHSLHMGMGTYTATTSGVPILLKSNSQLYGDGNGTVLQETNTADDGSHSQFVVICAYEQCQPGGNGTPDQNIKISNIKIASGRTGATTSVLGAVNFGNCHHCELSDAYITGVRGMGVILGASSTLGTDAGSLGRYAEDVKVTRTTIERTGFNPIAIVNAKNIEISDVMMINPSLDASACGMAGIDFEPNEGGDYLNNIIISSVSLDATNTVCTNFGNFINLNAGNMTPSLGRIGPIILSDNIAVGRNLSSATTHMSVGIITDSNMTGVTATGNHIRGAIAGMQIYGTHMNISGNFLEDTGQGGTRSVSLNGATYIKMDGNFLLGTTDDYIVETGSADFNIFRGNRTNGMIIVGANSRRWGNEITAASGNADAGKDAYDSIIPNGSSNKFGSVQYPWATLITNLPTADPHVVGQMWNDTGTVKVSAGP